MSASRYEDYGQAQLEALAAGALLVTAPSEGPYEALRLARRLDGRLVASQSDPSAMAAALEAALALPPEQRASYRARAAELVAPHSTQELEKRLREQVLPALMDGR
jgi:glycosyltransferase involved in cell wall biosynthesis